MCLSRGERKMNEKHKLILDDKLCAAYGKTWKDRRKDERKEAEKFLEIVLECCRDENLVRLVKLFTGYHGYRLQYEA